MFCKKGFLKISQNSPEKTSVRVFFLMWLQTEACNNIKNETVTQVFSCELGKNFKNTSVAASVFKHPQTYNLHSHKERKEDTAMIKNQEYKMGNGMRGTERMGVNVIFREMSLNIPRNVFVTQGNEDAGSFQDFMEFAVQEIVHGICSRKLIYSEAVEAPSKL